jgi:O-antigen/teichoic acid export membrane protein
LASAQFLTEFFHTSSPWPFILLAIAFPFCFSQGVDRGILQGKTRFGLLALSYQAEMWVRLGGAVVLVAAGFSVSGAVGAILLSFIATWYVARKVRKQLPHNGHFQPTERTKALHFAVPVSVALIGQVLLNNSDIIIVNHFFEQHAAGQYAAVALIGRIVFFATWSVVTTLFPVVAQLERQGKSHRHLLGYSLGLVGVISSLILVATILQPELIMSILFGNAYLESAPLLWMYALATAFYSMANVIITYRLSAGNGGGSVFAIVAGISQVLGLCIWHESLQQVVLIQVYIMAGLFTLLLLWDTWLTFQRVLVRKTL